MSFDLDSMWQTASAALTIFGMKILAALAAWFIGRFFIRIAVRITGVAMNRQRVDPTLGRYVQNVVNVGLHVLLIIAVLGYFGVETTSFAALIAAMGIAIGAAWAGLLANFAAGAFLIVLRPFKVGDYVKVAGIEGSVKEIGLFASTIMTADNVTTFVGNNKIFGDTIYNYSASPHRRVERTAQLAHGVDPHDAIERLREAISKIPNVQKDPAPTIEIVDFNNRGPVLAVRPNAHPDHYWQVYFDTNRAIAKTFGDAGYPIPEDYVRNTSSDIRKAAA